MVYIGGIYLGIKDMVYTVHCMLCTICYARHTMVYIIQVSINHGIPWYIVLYTILSSLHSSQNPSASLSPAWASASLSPAWAAPPPGQVPRSSCQSFKVWTSLASFCQSLSIPLLSFFHSDPARLPLPIVPHPVIELIEPASLASPHAGICSSSSPVPKAVGQGGMLYWYVTHSGASASSISDH